MIYDMRMRCRDKHRAVGNEKEREITTKTINTLLRKGRGGERDT